MTSLYIEFKLKPTSDFLDLYIWYAEYKLPQTPLNAKQKKRHKTLNCISHDTCHMI